jgi:hypothetical protein
MREAPVVGRHGPERRQPRYLPEEHRGDPGRAQDLPIHGASEDADQLVHGGVARDESSHAGLGARQDLLLILIGNSQGNHPRLALGRSGGQPERDRTGAHRGRIDENDVGPAVGNRVQNFIAR